MKPEVTHETIPITVIPGTPNGNEVPCEIQGPKEYVANNAIFLSPDVEYAIEFTLAGNDFEWGESPFWCQEGMCPTGPTNGRITFKDKGGRKVTATAGASSGKALSFYRLNFQDPYRCDPIIINT
jgi:hypothetical protein